MTDATTSPAAAGFTAARAASGPLAPARRELEDFIDAPLPPCAALVIEQISGDEAAAHGATIGAFDRVRETSDLRATVRRRIAMQRENAAASRHKPTPEQVEMQEAEISKAERQFVAAKAAQATVNENWQNINATKTAICGFLLAHQPAKLKAAPLPKLPPDATVETSRARLAAIDDEITAVENSPLTRKEVIEDLKREVGEIAARGRPSISARAFDGRPAHLREALMLASGPNNVLLGDAGAAFWTWLFHDEIVAALIEQVPADEPGALSREARAERLAALRDERLQVEYAEEALIRQARAQGRLILRRPDASPEAILMVEVRGRV